MDTIIKHGTVVTATDTYQADIGIRQGKVVQIGQALASEAGMRIIDATNRYVFPGGVDSHTHLDSPSQGVVTADDFRTGTIAAACGGTTAIVDFCFQTRGHSLADGLADWHRRADGRAVIDYGFHMAIVDMTDAVFEELLGLPEQGVTSFKLFMAYRGGPMIDDWTLVRALSQAKACGGLVMVHAENGDAVYLLQRQLIAAGKTAPQYHAVSRPPRVEAEATARAIALAEVLGTGIYIVHVSCAEALEEVLRGRARGVPVLAETCPQYLYTSEEDLARPDFEGGKYVFTPPPRLRHQQEVLWTALGNGALQACVSDHSVYNHVGQKDIGRDDFTKIPNGAPGIEERLMVVFQGVHTGKLTLNRFVEVVATAPAKMFGLYPEKGTIAIGSDADLVIWNPTAELTITQSALHHNVDYTLFEGWQVRGVPETVLLRGQVIVEGREFVGQPGMGLYVRRKRAG